MTPYHLIRETPARISSWPTAWKVLVCSALSMALAVVLMAWHASRFCAERHDHARPDDSFQLVWPTRAEIRTRMELGCDAMESMRASKTGFYEEAP